MSAHLLRGLAANPALPDELLDRLIGRLADGPLARASSQRGAAPATGPEEDEDEDEIGEPLIRALAAGRGRDRGRSGTQPAGAPLDVLAHLAAVTRIGPVLLPRIASASPAELADTAASADARVRRLVAEHRDLAPELRDALAADPDASVVNAVAPHPGLPDALLRAMVARHGVRVLARVAANPDAPPALLEELARHDPPVRRAFRAIAVHPHATAAALIACLDDRRARPLAARHPAMAAEVLVGLLTDDDHEVARAAAANPALPVGVMAGLLTGGP